VPWQEVQKTDPDVAPLAHYFVRVEVVNEEGPRFQQFHCRGPAGLQHTDELLEIGKNTAKGLGFFPTGRADAS
jgi:hypothetical protein